MTQDMDSEGPQTPGREGDNAPAFSVSEISGAVKKTLETRFGQVRVRGEVSGYRGPQSSGHVYFTLKDEGAKLDVAIWKGVFQGLRFRPEEGMEVILSGRISSFPGSSKYQLIASSLEPAGEGALMAMLEKQKRLLAAEGLFDEERKKPLPFLPEVVGVVASPTGAVIRDILHRLADRFPRRVILWPAAAQGENCPPEVSAGIRGFNALKPGGPIPRPDVIIVARGGGSIEDLWGYNSAAVVRAAAASEIPLISAVGHETDVTLIDFAADKRAPTPTAAAEMAVPVRAGLVAFLEDLETRRRGAMRRGIEDRRATLRGLARALPRPESLLETPRQRLDAAAAGLPRALALWRAAQERRFAEASGKLEAARGRLSERRSGAARALAVTGERLNHAPQRLIALKRRDWAARPLPSLRPALARRAERLEMVAGRLDSAFRAARAQRIEKLRGLGQLLESYSFKGVLARGFALARDAEGKPIRDAAALAPGDLVALTLQKGEAKTRVLGPEEGSAPQPPLTKK
ncbi:exodeoxyribonuclease VII large subunit [Neomegalonema perideroedes]|uniref:exodeoxyribonuclease VII large subunit n=1 Tax=Neomegalonema perideroedes TaxID=217219 RepID=UPI00039CFC64|nr:exodeoxyribonuclease VII large subunit [Neomegalonema perideroedes]